MPDIEIALEIDASGLNCPLPLLKAKQGLKQIKASEVLLVMATDPGSVRDFRSFCDLSGHQLLHFEQNGECYCYTIKKSGS